MRHVTAETIRALIIAECSDAVHDLGLDPEALGDDFDLRVNGVIDSLGFLELVVALEDDLGLDLDLAELPAEELTVLGPLAREVASQVSGQRGAASAASEAGP
jgi:acyl carrier protein